MKGIRPIFEKKSFDLRMWELLFLEKIFESYMSNSH